MKKSIVIVGLGALGSAFVEGFDGHLFNRVLVVDFDKVEPSNITEYSLYDTSQVSLFKGDVIVQYLKRKCGDLDVESFNGDVSDLGVGLLQRFDILISCVDNRLARVVINRMCRFSKTPWIDGATGERLGRVSFYSGEAGCYECSLGKSDLDIIAAKNSCVKPEWVDSPSRVAHDIAKLVSCAMLERLAEFLSVEISVYDAQVFFGPGIEPVSVAVVRCSGNCQSSFPEDKHLISLKADSDIEELRHILSLNGLPEFAIALKDGSFLNSTTIEECQLRFATKNIGPDCHNLTRIGLERNGTYVVYAAGKVVYLNIN